MVRLVISIALLGLVTLEASADVPQPGTLVLLGLSLLSLIFTTERGSLD